MIPALFILAFAVTWFILLSRRADAFASEAEQRFGTRILPNCKVIKPKYTDAQWEGWADKRYEDIHTTATHNALWEAAKNPDFRKIHCAYCRMMRRTGFIFAGVFAILYFLYVVLRESPTAV